MKTIRATVLTLPYKKIKKTAQRLGTLMKLRGK